MKLSIGTKIFIGFAVALVALLAIGAVIKIDLAELETDTFWVTHTVEVQQQLEALQAAVPEAESAARGAQLVQSDSFKAEFATAYDKAQKATASLTTLTQDNPDQVARLARLKPLLEQRFAQIKRLLELPSSGPDTQTVLRTQLVEEGAENAATISGIVHDMENEESALLKDRRDRAHHMSDLAANTIVGGTFAAFAVVGLIGLFVTRSITTPLRQLGEGRGHDRQRQIHAPRRHPVARRGGPARDTLQPDGRAGAAAAGGDGRAGRAQAEPRALLRAFFRASAMCSFSAAACFRNWRRSSMPATRFSISSRRARRGRCSGSRPATRSTRPAPHSRRARGSPGRCWSTGSGSCSPMSPNDYLKINSGLGSARPAAIVIQPIVFEGEPKGVLEPRIVPPAQADAIGLSRPARAQPRHRAQHHRRGDEDGGIAAPGAPLRAASPAAAGGTSAGQRGDGAGQRGSCSRPTRRWRRRSTCSPSKSGRWSGRTGRSSRRARSWRNARSRSRRPRATSRSSSRTCRTSCARRLTACSFSSKMLADNPTANLTAKQVQYAETIHSSGADLLELINEVLDLAKIESGSVDFDPRPLALTELKEMIEQTFLPVAEGKNLAFNLDFAPDLPAAITTDARRLQQVLKNLLANAFKFTERGSVTLKVAPARGGWPRPFATLDEAGHGPRLLGARHRRRSAAGQARAHLRRVPAGRHRHVTQVRWHGTRPLHQPRTGDATRRRAAVDRELGPRQHLHALPAGRGEKAGGARAFRLRAVAFRQGGLQGAEVEMTREQAPGAGPGRRGGRPQPVGAGATRCCSSIDDGPEFQRDHARLCAREKFQGRGGT